MKKYAYFLFVLTFFSLMAMEEKKGMKRSAHASEEEEITLAEPEVAQEELVPIPSSAKREKLAKIEEKIEKRRSPLEELPAELQAIIIKELKSESIPLSVEPAQLYIAANNMRNLMMTHPAFKEFLNDPNFAGILIKELAARYAGNDVVEAAVALATDAAGQWLATQFDDRKVQRDALTKLFSASRQGQIGVIKFLLTYIPSTHLAELVNKGINGDTPLLVAILFGHLRIVERLLAIQGIDVNKTDLNGYTPLMIAAREGKTAIAQRLLTMPGIDVNKGNKKGVTALMFASLHYPAMVAQLLAAPGINLTLHNQRMRALHAAIINDHPVIVKQLLEAPGIEINQKNPEGHTLLWYAQQSTKPNKDAIIKLLKDKGATE